MPPAKLAELGGRSGIGLSVPPNTRLGRVRRLLLKLLWPQFSGQAETNAIVVECLTDLFNRAEFFENHANNAVTHLMALQQHADVVHDELELALERVELAKRQAFVTYHDGVAALRGEIAVVAAALNERRELTEQLESRIGSVSAEFTKRLNAAFTELRIRVSQVDVFVDEVKRARPQLPTPADLQSVPSSLEALYPSIEAAFRGSEDLIKKRVEYYLHDILTIPKRGPILDLGSGRGEWLEVLRDAQVDAYGIETNLAYVKMCQEKGLRVQHEDAISHLESVPPQSLGAVTAIQLVEHLEIGKVVELIDRATAALQPGGVLILETPNPENVVVGASTFYLDPTHRKPIHPQLLAFLVSTRGLGNVEIRELQRDEELVLQPPSDEQPWAADLIPVIEVINASFTNPQDYAVVGRRL